MTQRKPPTLEEVAKESGLSRATVSRVINDSPKVSDDVRRTVEAAIERLGYTPNRAARSLVTRRSNSIGLVVAESATRFVAEPFFASLVRGVSTALSGTELQLIMIMARSESEGVSVERYLQAGHVDGVLLVSAHVNDPLVGYLAAQRVPAVLSGRPLTNVELPYVDADNEAGAHQATAHLIEQGRSKIGTITGPQDMAVGLDRLAGYRRALQEAGIEEDPALIAYGDFGHESGYKGMRELLGRSPDLDAVFAASDPMAVAAMRALSRSGRQIPEDVAVIGFDNSSLAETTDPPLTTVHQPVEQIGMEMIRLLLPMLDDPDWGAAHKVLPTELVIRRSA